jgi:selenocysteine lyase/cysteine desulfurase
MRNSDFRNAVVGANISVPVIGGEKRRYINFDNAASTPSLKYVWERIAGFKDYYSSVHRGTGFKSIVSTRAYDDAHLKTLKFVGADPDYFTAIFMKNTSDAINKLARRIEFKRGDVVLSSLMEHHSNDLPWRAAARTEHIEIDDKGRLDMDDYRRKLKKFDKRIRLAAVTGASNVNGLIPPLREMARMAHDIGAEFLVDAAQLAPHRKIRMGRPGEPESFDYLAFSAHKMYAPFGTGVLIGPRKTFVKGDPDSVGGGTVNYVTRKEVQWAHLPDKEEAGSPNVIGAVSLAAAMDFFNKTGFSKIAAHEKELTRYALKRFTEFERISLYGPSELISGEDRVGAVSFNIDGYYHAIAAAILSYEGAIAVRNGCFCAHPYIQRLLRLSDKQSQTYRDEINRKVRSHVPGMIRISFGLYNSKSEIDRFFEMIGKIVKGTYKGEYYIEKRSGEAFPAGFRFPGIMDF